MMVYGQPKNLSKFRAFGCRAFMTLNKDRRGPGKHVPRAVEGINLGFASDSNSSGYVIYVPESKKVYISNQVRFDESVYPYRKQSMVDKHVADNMVDILSEISPRTWEDYDKRKPRKYYKEVHYDSRTDELILQVVD